MGSCEKCWGRAYTRSRCDASKSQAEHYHDILKETESSPCSPKDQAGQFWDEEKQCDSRDLAERSKEAK